MACLLKVYTLAVLVAVAGGLEGSCPAGAECRGEEMPVDATKLLQVHSITSHAEKEAAGEDKPKQPTKKQLKWILTNLMMLEAGVCERRGHYKGENPCGNDYEEEESSGGVVCSPKCGGNLAKSFPLKCDDHFCSYDQADCTKKHASIFASFGMFVLNLLPGPTDMRAIKKAADRVAMRQAMKTAAKNVYKKLKKKARSNLKHYMKGLAEDAKESFIDEGLTGLMASTVADKLSGDKKALAKEIVSFIDPTGVIDLMNAITAPECKALTVMP